MHRAARGTRTSNSLQHVAVMLETRREFNIWLEESDSLQLSGVNWYATPVGSNDGGLCGLHVQRRTPPNGKFQCQSGVQYSHWRSVPNCRSRRLVEAALS